MTKAKQTVKNKSEQNATANASLTVSSTVGVPGIARSSGGEEEQAAAGATGTAADEEEPGPNEATSPWNCLPPIYLALAISINLAANYQNKNANFMEEA